MSHKPKYQPRLEALEDRTVPATIRLIGGSVFISRPIGALTITPQTPTSVQITDGVTVTVTAGSNIFVTGNNLSNNITFDLGTSSYGGNLFVNSGNGNDTITVTGANALLGNVTVLTGNGNDEVNLAADGASTIGGNVLINDVRGDDTVTFSADGGTANFLGSITTTGSNFLNFFDSTVGGRVTSTLGRDNTPMTFFSWLGGPVNFNGGLNIFGGSGDDDIEIDDAVIEGNAVVSVGEGDNLLFFAPATTSGNFTWTSGGGDDNIIFNPSGSNFDGDATFNLGGGDNSMTVLTDTTIFNGNLLVTAGSGANTIAGGFASEVAGNVTFQLGHGDNTLDFTAGSIGGDLNLYLGNGTNAVTLADTFIGGRFRVRTGNGTNTVDLAPTIAALYDLDVRFGNGDDSFSANANCTLTGLLSGGTGTDTFAQGGAVLTPTLVIDSFEA